MLGDIVTIIFNLFLIIVLATIILLIIYILVHTFVIIIRNDICKRRARKLDKLNSAEFPSEEESK